MITIRTATIHDAEILAKIGLQSFKDAFADHPLNDPHDMQVYMEEVFTPDSLRTELEAKDSVFFVAEIENSVVGYARLQQNHFEEGIVARHPIELCRLYALREFIGKGVGKSLMLRCLEFARAHNHDLIWLGVWEFNFNAQKFYRSFGFERCGDHIFQLGSDPQTDWLMQRKID